jgi:hypothetical protein
VFGYTIHESLQRKKVRRWGENLTNGRPSPSLKTYKGLLFLEEAMREKEEEEKAKEGEG